MNRKTIIILISILIAAIIGVSVTLYILSFRTVTFDIVPENVSITILKEGSDQQLDTLNQDGSLQLQDGTYEAVPTHKDYTSNSIPFTVDSEDITLTIDPAFSSARLESMADSERTAIDKLLRQSYPNVIKDFTIQPGTLYEKGQWYATTLQQNPLLGGQQGDMYRVVLHKEDTQWRIVAGPKIVLSTQEYPDVPFAILTDINSR